MQNLNLRNKKKAEINSKTVIVLAIVIVIVVALIVWGVLSSGNSEKATQTEKTDSQLNVNVLPSPDQPPVDNNNLPPP